MQSSSFDALCARMIHPRLCVCILFDVFLAGPTRRSARVVGPTRAVILVIIGVVIIIERTNRTKFVYHSRDWRVSGGYSNCFRLSAIHLYVQTVVF